MIDAAKRASAGRITAVIPYYGYGRTDKKDQWGRSKWSARKKLLWDGENMKITNLEDANQFVTRGYRKGWEL